VLTQLAVGEALVSLLDETGQPAVVQRALIVPPRSQLAPLGDDERRGFIEKSLVFRTYEETIDRESASEILAARAQVKTSAEAPAVPAESGKSARFNPAWQHRPARWEARGLGGIHGQERREDDGKHRGPRDHPRSARRPFRRPAAPLNRSRGECDNR
jgi:hypothetical protein